MRTHTFVHVCTFPRTHSPSAVERIISNFKQVELSEEDYQKVSAVGHNNHHRFNIPINYTPKWSINIFGEVDEKEAEATVKTA